MNFNDLKIVFLPTEIYKVDDHLLRGNAVFTPVKMLKLKKQNVTQVIDLRNEQRLSTKFLRVMEKFYCKCTGVKYKRAPFSLSTQNVPEMDVFERINSEIINNKGKTYLHCHYGVHRTNLCVAMYERSLGKDSGKIVEDLIKNYWENTTAKAINYEKNKKSLELFLKKFFPKFI